MKFSKTQRRYLIKMENSNHSLQVGEIKRSREISVDKAGSIQCRFFVCDLVYTTEAKYQYLRILFQYFSSFIRFSVNSLIWLNTENAESNMPQCILLGFISESQRMLLTFPRQQKSFIKIQYSRCVVHVLLFLGKKKSKNRIETSFSIT